MARYSDIRRGAQLKLAYDNWRNYIETERDPDFGSRGERAATIPCGVYPFSFDLQAGEYVAANGTANPRTSTTSTGIEAAINGVANAKVLIGATLTGTPVDIGVFKAARVTTFQNTTKTFTPQTSKVTKQKYAKYAGSRFSCPFGRDTVSSTDKMGDVANAVKAAFKARTGLAVNRVSISPERFST